MDDLQATVVSVMHLQERRRTRLSCASTTTAVTCRAWCSCRATGTRRRCGSAWRRSCARPSTPRRSTTAPGSARACWPASTSSSASPRAPSCRTSTATTSSAGSSRPPGRGTRTSPTRCGRTSARRRRRACCGSGAAASRRRTRRTSRLGSRSPTFAGSRRWTPGRRALRMNLYEPSTPRRTSGASSSTGGRRCRSPTCCPISAPGREVVDERPYEIRRADGDERVGVRLWAALHRARPAPERLRELSRTPSRRCGAGGPRATASTALVLLAGLTWRRRRAAGVREVPAPDRSTFSQDYMEERGRPTDLARLLVRAVQRPVRPRPPRDAAIRRHASSPKPCSRRSTPRSTTSRAWTRTGSCAASST